MDEARRFLRYVLPGVTFNFGATTLVPNFGARHVPASAPEQVTL